MSAPRIQGPSAAAWAAAFVAVLVYLNTLGNGFALDDQHIVVDNEAIHALESLPTAVRSPYWPGDLGRILGLWRPLSSLALGLVWVSADGAPLAFHVANVLLHAAATGAVVLLVGRMLPVGAALLAGLVFAVHPVHVEAVANVVGLAELLSALLFLLACILWWDGSGEPGGQAWATKEDPGARRPAFSVPGPRRLPLLLALYAGAFAAKESAVMLPAVLPLLDALRRPIPLRALPRYLASRAATFTLLGCTGLALLVARFVVLWRVADPLPPPGAALLAEIPRIWTVAAVWPEYVRLLLFPASLSSDYAPALVPVVTVWTGRGLLGVALVLGTLLGALFLWRVSLLPEADGGSARRELRVVPFGVLWFVVTVLPVSNVLFLAGVVLAERNLYLPSVGFAAVLGWALHRALATRRASARALALVVLVLLAGRTLARNPAWASTETITTRLIVEHPDGARAQWALGSLQESGGAVREANASYRRALGLMSGDYAVLVDVGRRMMNQGKPRAAVFLLTRALAEAPGSPNAAELLAVLYAAEGDHARTLRWARLATTLNPENTVSWHLLANALEGDGRVREAVAAREEVIRRGEGERWQQWLSLARLLARSGDTAASAAALDTARLRAGPALGGVVDSLYRALPTP